MVSEISNVIMCYFDDEPTLKILYRPFKAYVKAVNRAEATVISVKDGIYGSLMGAAFYRSFEKTGSL